MTFWIIVSIGIFIAIALLKPSGEPYYVVQANDAFGLFIGGVAVGAIILRLIG